MIEQEALKMIGLIILNLLIYQEIMKTFRKIVSITNFIIQEVIKDLLILCRIPRDPFKIMIISIMSLIINRII